MVERLKFAVLGAGHGGRAIAAYLAIVGCNVNLYNRTPENIHIIQKSGGIFLTFAPYLEDYIFPEGIERLEPIPRREHLLTPKTDRPVEEDVKQVFGKLNSITSNIEEAVKDRDVIMVVVPATGHEFMAEQCAPYLRDGQVVLLNPGRCFGALEFYKIVYDYYKGNPPDIAIAEAQTLVYACRRTKPRSVRVLGVKLSVNVAAIPAYKTNEAVELLDDSYPQFTPTKSVMNTSLGNMGCVFHVPITILNATRIDRKHDFEYYIEGVTEHTAPIIEGLDRERLAVANAMDIEAISARKWLRQTYGSEGADLYEAIQNTRSYKGIESPASINTRYIWEDVPTGLVPLSSLGRKLDVRTPLIDSFIHQATAAMRKEFNINFFKRGRTLRKLGLGDMSIDEIKEFAETGCLNP